MTRRQEYTVLAAIAKAGQLRVSQMRDVVRQTGDGRQVTRANRSRVVQELITREFVICTSSNATLERYDHSYRLSPAGRKRLDFLGALVRRENATQSDMFDVPSAST
jgi:hypothetical protein